MCLRLKSVSFVRTDSRTSSGRELCVPRNAGSVTVFRTPPSSPVPETLSPSKLKDDVFSPPHKEPSEAFFDRPTAHFKPVEITVHLPDSDVDQVQFARQRFSEVLHELIDSEKDYLNALGNVQVHAIVLYNELNFGVHCCTVLVGRVRYRTGQ